MKYSRLRGTRDILPGESALWQHVIIKSFEIFNSCNYSFILTPTIEDKNLFIRGTGEGTDIVQKEMYDFKDKKGRDIVLRPEGTPSIVRAYIENSMPEKSNVYYMGQMFRYEKPQKGRNREFYQIGAESFGDKTPYKDAEIIKMADSILKNTGVKDYKLHINTLNCPACGGEYIKKLKDYFEKNRDKLCGGCINKLDRTPLRILDCKNESCGKVISGAPKLKDNLCGPCKNHFNEVKSRLKDIGVEFTEDTNLVRGLDYYTGVVFEFITGRLGRQQNTLLAGGRYDRLVKELGGKNVPATGFGLGIDRVVDVLIQEGNIKPEESVDCFVITDEKSVSCGFETLFKLREKGIKSAMNFESKSFKSQMREADSRNARYAVIIGENELKNNTVSVKNMKDGSQKEVKLEDFISGIK